MNESVTCNRLKHCTIIYTTKENIMGVRIKAKGLTFILGISRIGASIASLLNESNVSVVAVDNNPLSFNKLPDSFGGQQVLGDATDVTFLENHGIKDAKRVIVVTEDDNINILIGHLCDKIFQVENIYIRLQDDTKGSLLAGSNVKAFFPFSLSRQNLVSLLEDEQ